MIKQAGYLLFALFFHLFRLCPRKKNKVFLVATHDAGPDGNIGIVSRRLKEEKPEYEQVWFTRNNTIRRPVDFFVKKAYHLATASYVFLDNEFLPMAYLHLGKNGSALAWNRHDQTVWTGCQYRNIKKIGIQCQSEDYAFDCEFRGSKKRVCECICRRSFPDLRDWKSAD